ncbi:MAG: FtsQ-type POTRA domain-containing protein, partial [Moorella sp. (in: Bacteria)]|nr:FtsQ-type POTRA domain-containing protein [Moorella sp. (in: firmicutes)]
HIPSAELENLMGLARGINLWQVDAAAVEKRLVTHPLVAGARVSRHWPRTLVVEITERTPVALLVQDGSFLVVDSNGVVMERVPRIGHLTLPLISGLGRLDNPGPGTTLNHAGLQSALAVIRQLPPREISQIQEIIASSPDNLQLIWAGNILVKFGDGEDVGNKLARLHEALQGLAGKENILYIDISFQGPPVVRFKQPENQDKQE